MAEQDWNKVELTEDMSDSLYSKYGKWNESYGIFDEMLDDLYNYTMLKD